nr:retrovirus-related Pol polyprotein from transposon TNT 1-94 [Tanacetum cinerariifolium]
DDDDINDLKKITTLLAKDFNRKKYYAKPTNNNLRTSSASSSANKKPEYVKSVEKKEDKKADEKKRDMSKVKCYNCNKEENFAKDCKKAKMESSSDFDHEINANLVFMAQIEKVLSDSDESSSSSEETIAEVAYYTSESESESEYETSEYYNNSTNYGLFVNDKDDQEFFHDTIESASENFIKNHIDSQKDYDKSEVDHNDSEEKEHLIDKLIRKFNHKIAKCQKRIEKANQQSKDLENQNKDLQEKYDVLINQVNTFEEQNNEFNEQMKVLNEKNVDLLAQTKVLQDQLKLVEMNNNVLRLQEKILEKETKISELEGCVSNKDVEIGKCLERLNECENKLHKIGQTNQTIHMIMPSKDTLYNGKKGIGFEILSYFEKAKDLRPSLYDEKVIGLGYTPMFLIHSNEALEIEKFKRARENKIEFAYDYGNLNASYVNEKINFLDDYFQEKINLDFEKIDSPFQQTSSLRPYVLTVILEKIIIDLEDEVVNLDTFSSVRRPKQSSVIWKKKGSSNTSNDDLSSVSHSKLNKDVKRYSRKDLLSCNNSHLGETSSAYVCNDAMNVSCNSRLCDLFDENNLFIFDDESVRISPVSKMHFKKNPRDSLNVRFKRNSNQSLPRTVHRWLPKMQSLAEPVAKWIPRIVQICLWIIDSGCSKPMTGNHALLINFMEKFLGMVRFGNNDFEVIAGYEDVVIGSMTINKVYYVEGLGHNLFSVGQFCDKGLEVAFRNSTGFVRNEDGVDLLTGVRSSNLYTIALNKVASNSSTCLLAKAYYLQSWLWHQRISHLNFATTNNLVKNNLFQGLPKMKWEKDHLCSACEQRKILRKHHKSKMAFDSNKPLYLLHMDLCGPMHVESINGKRYVLVVVDDYSWYTWVFFLHSKDEASDVIISLIKKSKVNLQLQIQYVRTDNGTEFKNKNLAKFFDEIMKSSTMDVKTSINEEVFHEVSESFQMESSLNDNGQQSQEEVILPQTNTQSIPIN